MSMTLTHADSGVSVFVKNETIPLGHLRLIRDGETLWQGPAQDVPADEFRQSSEAHCHPITYDEIAKAAEATGKGQKMH